MCEGLLIRNGPLEAICTRACKERVAYLLFLGSSGPFPWSFLTSISLLLLITSRIFPNEPLRWRAPEPSWKRQEHMASSGKMVDEHQLFHTAEGNTASDPHSLWGQGVGISFCLEAMLLLLSQPVVCTKSPVTVSLRCSWFHFNFYWVFKAVCSATEDNTR